MQSIEQTAEYVGPGDEFLRNVLGELRVRVREDQYRAWFHELVLLNLMPDVAEFGVRSGFVRDWILRNYLNVVEESVAAASPDSDRRVKISLDRDSARTTHLRTPLVEIVPLPHPRQLPPVRPLVRP